MNDPHCLLRAKSWYLSNELTRLFELLISLLGINGVPRVVDDKQEVGYTPAIHPATSDVRKKRVHWKSKGWGLSFQMGFPVHVLLNKPRIAAIQSRQNWKGHTRLLDGTVCASPDRIQSQFCTECKKAVCCPTETFQEFFFNWTLVLPLQFEDTAFTVI